MRKSWSKVVATCVIFAMIVTMLPASTVYAAKKKNTISRADVLAKIEKIIGAKKTSDDMGSITDVKESDACYKTISVALNAGMIQADAAGEVKPEKKADYKFVASVLSAVTEKPATEILGNKPANEKLTKKEFNAFLKKNFPHVNGKSTEKVVKGNVVINKPGVVLRDVTITGDLLIGDGVGTGEATLDNVTVNGNTVVRGGGENSVILKGNSKLSNIIIRQVNNKVSLKVQGDAQIKMVYINDGCNDVKIVGSVGTLTVNGKNLNVSLEGAKLNKLVTTEKAKNAAVLVDAGSSVKKATLNAKGSVLKGAGEVKTVDVNVSGATVETNTDPSQIKYKEGTNPNNDPQDTDVPAPSNSPAPTTPGDNSQPTTGDTGNGSGGGSGSSGGGSGSSGSGSGSSGSGSGSSGSGSGSTGGGSGSTGGGSGSTGSGSGNSGSGSGSSGSGSGGTTPTPTPTPVPEPENKDARYDVGYPKIELNAETGKVTVSYKLKEGVASEENPAEIYSLLSNGDMETNSRAVLHGHLGIVDDDDSDGSLISADVVDYHKITDSDVHEYEYSDFYISGQEELVFYSVIDGKDGLSSAPTKVIMDDNVGSSFDTFAPWCSGAYYNQARDKVCLLFYEKLDTESVPEASCFSIIQTGAKVEAVSVAGVTIENDESSSGVNFVILTLEGQLQEDQGYSVTYTKPEGKNKLQDTANEPNATRTFTKEILSAAPVIKEIYLSEDKTYLSIIVEPGVRRSDIKKCQIEIDGTAYDIGAWGASGQNYTFKIRDPKLNESGSHNCTIKAKEGQEVKDLAGDMFTSTDSSDFTTVAKVEIGSIQYKKSTSELNVTMNGDCRYNSCLGCCIVLTIDNKKYYVRGMMVSDEENPAVFKAKGKKIAHIPFSSGSSIKARFTGDVTDKSQRPADPQDNIPVTVVD